MRVIVELLRHGRQRRQTTCGPRSLGKAAAGRRLLAQLLRGLTPRKTLHHAALAGIGKVLACAIRAA